MTNIKWDKLAKLWSQTGTQFGGRLSLADGDDGTRIAGKRTGKQETGTGWVEKVGYPDCSNREAFERVRGCIGQALQY